MALHRFFVSPESISARTVRLTADYAHQIKDVLRLRPGDQVILLDNTGTELVVELGEVESNCVIGEVKSRAPSTNEPQTHVTLYQATLKARKFEWVLQKGTELGVSEFIPVVCDRSIVEHLRDVDRKLTRWESIVREAAEQCRRGRLPLLLPAMMFAQACQRVAESDHLNLILWEEEKSISLKACLSQWQQEHDTIQAINLFVGPEGGFSTQEMEQAQQYDLRKVSLGPRILRAETAGMAAAAAIFYELEG